MPDIHEVHVGRQEGFVDPRGNDVAAELKRISGLDASVKTTTVYRMLGPNLTDAETLATRALVDPISEVGKVNPGYDGYSDVRVEVAYHPDITDPVSGSVKKVGDLLGVPIEEARVSVIYEFEGISQEQADSFASDSSLINLQVQEPIYEPPTGLKLVVRESRYHETRTMNATEDELHMIDVELGTNLGQEKMKAIQRESKRMERNFTADEIHHLGGTWTEHCEHESFTARIFKDGIEKPSFFDRIKTTSRKYFKDKVATAFDDNAGGIHFYDGEVVLIKWETHNSPSAIEPKNEQK